MTEIQNLRDTLLLSFARCNSSRDGKCKQPSSLYNKNTLVVKDRGNEKPQHVCPILHVTKGIVAERRIRSCRPRRVPRDASPGRWYPWTSTADPFTVRRFRRSWLRMQEHFEKTASLSMQEQQHSLTSEFFSMHELCQSPASILWLALKLESCRWIFCEVEHNLMLTDTLPVCKSYDDSVTRY